MSAQAENMTVTHVAHTSERGGAELALRRLLDEDDRGWSAVLALPRSTDDGVFSGVVEHGVRVVHAGKAQPPGASKASLGGAVSFAWSLLRQAVALRSSGALRDARVVHANSTRAGVYAALAVLGTRRPLVVHLRDRMEPDAIGTFGHLAFTRLVARRATGFIANSESTADTVRPGLRRGQFVEVVPSPIGMERVERSPEQRGDRPRIGMVARLDPWKGQDLLIRAFAEARLDDDADLVLIGDAAFGHEKYADDLMTLVAELGLKNVSFQGFRPDVTAAVDELDVCVQYSVRPEPLGQNVLQYLARGKAVVVAAEGGPSEWVVNEVNGLAVKPRSVNDLAKALGRLAPDAGLRSRLAAGAVDTPGLPTDRAVAHGHAAAFARALSYRNG